MKKYALLLLLLAVSLRAAYSQCTANAGPDQVLTCTVTSIALQAGSNVPNPTYVWTGPNGFTSTMQNPQVSWPGAYTLIVTDPSNGCTASATMQVLQDVAMPDIIATGGEISCANPVVTLTASSSTPGVIYAWSGPGGFTSTLQNPQASQIGTYVVTATAVQNGCTATAVAVVTPGPVITVTAAIQQVRCFGGADGSITTTALGGKPPYTYTWTGPQGFTANTKDLTSIKAGTYTLTISDSEGCSSIQSFTLAQPAAIKILQSQVNPVGCSGQANGAIALSVSGGASPYAYAWSNGATTQSMQGLSAGVYTITITDANGCTSVFNFTVPSAPPLSISAVICESTISAQAAGGTPPYQYLWNYGWTNPVAVLLKTGTYTVTATDSKGCSAAETFTLDASAMPCTRITGYVRLDENANCQTDAGEPGLSGWYLQASGPAGAFYGVTDSAGAYVISVVPGNYTVTLVAPPGPSFICQNDVAVTLAQAGDTANRDFLAQLPDPDCPRLSVDLSTPVLRRCFNNNFYYLNYCNNSPAPVPNAYVTLQLDPFLSVQAAQRPYTDLGNNLLRFDLGTVPANDCDAFWVRVMVSCNAVLGQSHCSEAHIYPDTLCDPPHPQWSGAQVQLASVCAGDSLRFILKNTGVAPMSQALDYIVIEDGIMTYQGMGAPLNAGEQMIVSVPANGSTWRVEAKQEPLAPLTAGQPVLSVEGCSSAGAFSTGYLNQFVLGNTGPFVDEDCTPNVGSYDPNDKQGFPVGYGPSHYIRPGTEIEYRIRFQNTGTDTAFNVVIRDTLPVWLDPLTLRPGGSSHPYRFALSGPGILIFDFENILLPDSNVNEAASHGFVQFRVSPRANAPLETDILNRAAIYFDFNDPVITNTAIHRIGVNFLPTVSNWEPVPPALQVQINPHPVADAAWLTLEGAATPGDYRLRIFDLTGRPVQEMAADVPRFLLQRGALPSGMYLFRIEQGGVVAGSGRLLLR